MLNNLLQEYENQTQTIAKELLETTRKNKKSLWGKVKDTFRLDEKLMDFAMSNQGLRVQLFRFIDCLPSLRSNTEIARHLQQYLTGSEVELPSALKSLMNFTEPTSPPAQLTAVSVSKAVETLAFKYISGETIPQVLKTLKHLRDQKQVFSIDLLGEAVISEVEAEKYLATYLDLLEQLAQAAKKWSIVKEIDEADGQALPQVQVSVKLTAFYSQFSPIDPAGSKAKVCERIRILLRKAQELGAGIHFDMEQYAYKDLTIAILKELLLEAEFRHRTDIGVTVQGYLKESERDLKGWIEWAKRRGNPITVRLVKGAYWDQETIKALQNHWEQPVYNQKAATDVNYENLIQILLENHEYLYAAIASHNVRTQAKASAIAEILKIPSRCFEQQVLYGMGDDIAKALVKRGHRVRVYAPYGNLLPGMAYLIRRLLENTANSSFLRQELEGRSIEELIALPIVKEDKKPLPTTGFKNAPDTNYSQTDLLKQAQTGLAKVKESLGKTYLPWIDGQYVETDTLINSENPSNPQEIVGKVGQINLQQAENALKGAKKAFTGWKNTPAAKRASILNRAAELMEEQRYELAAWTCLEVGKTLPQADAEVSEAIDFCNYYAAEMLRLEQGVNFDVAGETNRYHYQPRGLAVVISPWNFPLAITTGMTVAALVAGNCTLLKPAETSSVIAAKLVEILIAAGIPPGVLQFVPGKGSHVGSYMVEHPDVHLIAFTGSREVGCRIYAEAAKVRLGQKHLKRVIAEMGGKNGMIIDESADLDQAVASVVFSAFGYSGQKCSAASRVIVLESIYETFLNRLVEATTALNIGATEDPGTQIGPVIDAKAQSRILEYIEKGKQEGQLILSRPVPTTGYFVPPTIFRDIKAEATIAQEEIFGPVLAVIPVKDFTEALKVANSTDYALTGGLFSRTPEHIARANAEFEVGNLYINRSITGAIVSRQPFGGFKLSGVGSKAGGPDYLLQFLEPRHISENIQRQGFAPIEGAE